MFDEFVPAFLRDRMNDLNHSFEIPEFMLDSQVPQIPSWFYTEQFFANLLNKNPFISSDFNPDMQAETLFYENERRCAMLNLRFNKLFDHPELRELLFATRDNVRRILGDSPNIDLARFRFTSGATTSSPRGSCPLVRLVTGRINPRLFNHILSFGPPDPRFFLVHQHYSFQDFVEGKFVLKTAKISRLVCPENSYDMGVQSLLGDLMVARYRFSTGIDMSSAQQRHRDMAWLGSQLGHITTDDLVSGSHFLYNALVSYLLPPKWKVWTDAARSSSIKIGDKTSVLEHYMPNGNGFCSILQSIIFYAVIEAAIQYDGCRITANTDISVYGDDLIYPKEHTSTVRRFMRALGFITNLDKSFSTGFFRESCGGDYLNGHYVRPLYAKLAYSNSFEKTQLANLIMERYKYGNSYYIRRFWTLLVRSIPRTERLWGPTAMGNQCLHRWTPVSSWHPRGFFRPESRQRRLELGKKRRCKPELLSCKIATWRVEAKETTTFDQIANDRNGVLLTSQLINGGYMAGWGGHRVFYKRCEASRYRCGDGLDYSSSPATARFALLLLSYGVLKFSPDGKVVLQRAIGYNLLPKPGSELYHSIVKSEPFSYSNDVDEENPLSVFDVLKRKRGYDDQHVISLLHPNYTRYTAGLRFLALRQLAQSLHTRSADLSRLTAPSCMMDVDF